MRRTTRDAPVYLLIGLVFVWLVVSGCADVPAAESPTPAPPVVATAMPEPSGPETVVPTTPPSPAETVDARTVAPERVTEPPVQEPARAATPTLAPPTATPTPAKFSVADREALAESAFGYLTELSEDVGPRASATEDELKAAEFLMGQFTELGYSPELQEFETESLTAGVAVIVPERSVDEGIRARPMSGSIAGTASGRLEFIGLGKADDLPSKGLEGYVALVERGEITFRSKVEQVAGVGAVAAVIFNDRPGLFQGTLGPVRSEIPAVAISRADGEELRKLIADGEVEVAVTVEEDLEASRNIIMEVPGEGKDVVILGAHYDTVPDSIGANDNSSGMGVLLALAEELAGRSFPFTLRFIAFGSEETGLHGSRHYVSELADEELDNIRAMINLDVVGAGKSLRATGDRWLTRHVLNAADREGIALTVNRGFRGGGSDHASFREVGVPAIFFYGDDLARINSPEDTMEFINPDLLGDTATLVLDLLDSLENLRQQ